MIIFLIALLFSFNVEAKNLYVYKVEKITDGDTIKLDTSKDGSLLKELGLSVRIYGVDTPEKGSRAKCKKENDLANLATEFTTNLVGKREIMLDVKKWDKFGGRIVANVKVEGVDIAQELLKKGLARVYNGEKKKSWCD